MNPTAAVPAAAAPKTRIRGAAVDRPRVLIEEWLPAAAIGVECIRERSTGQQPPDKRLHVWWARRPLCVSRAAVLGSLLPADFPRDVFERLLGFWGDAQAIVDAQAALDWVRSRETAIRIANPHGKRAFKASLNQRDLDQLHTTVKEVWGEDVIIIDPMAGGGSIPLEAARMGFRTIANEYNPVACSVLEATVDYPFRFGAELARAARQWGRELRDRFNARVERLFPSSGALPPHSYIFARTVPCPDTGFDTPLVPDWHLLKPKSGQRFVAEPEVDQEKGTWMMHEREIGRGAGQLREPPTPTYKGGKGVSLFTGRAIPSDYIKAMAQSGRMKSALYAVVIKKMPKGLAFRPPTDADLAALDEAEKEFARVRPEWEKNHVIPTEKIPVGDKTGEPMSRGWRTWADMFTPRQLLCMGVLVEELNELRPEIVEAEGDETAEAIVHLLAFAVDKMTNYNSGSSFWHAIRKTMANTFDRHDFSFKLTHAEMAPCNAGAGLAWAIENVIDSYQKLALLPRHDDAKPAKISLGSATNLPQIEDGSITAVVVDPPYADNVQYSELADFFYVWLKRTQGHRRPEWFSTYLCEHDEEAVVNISRHKTDGEATKDARRQAHEFYQQLMAEVFAECRRILRDDGVLTVMFTHKKQEAWQALFASLIDAGFTINATWPVKTESEHSLHQAKKNAAQSTVLLVARKRLGPSASEESIGYWDAQMRHEIADRARSTASRLQDEGLNKVDQLVGSFGPSMEVFSRFDGVRTDTGREVGVAEAIDEASEAVSRWRIEQLAERGLEGVESEGRFYLLCWDVLGAAEFRFNEAHLLGKAVGMEVDHMIGAGLVSKKGDKIQMLSAQERRRDKAIEPDKVEEVLFGSVVVSGRRRKKDVLKVHPNDPAFRTALDGCHALALRYIEVGGGNAGVGNARALKSQQGWGDDSPVAKLMEALLRAAPEAVRHEPKNKDDAASKYPEFRAWHTLAEPLFDLEPPDWSEKPPVQPELFADDEDEDESNSEA